MNPGQACWNSVLSSMQFSCAELHLQPQNLQPLFSRSWQWKSDLLDSEKVWMVWNVFLSLSKHFWFTLYGGLCNDSVTEKAHTAGEGCEKIACLKMYSCLFSQKTFLEAFAKQHSKISMVFLHLNSNVFIFMFTITKLRSATRVNESRMCLSKLS